MAEITHSVVNYQEFTPYRRACAAKASSASATARAIGPELSTRASAQASYAGARSASRRRTVSSPPAERGRPSVASSSTGRLMSNTTPFCRRAATLVTVTTPVYSGNTITGTKSETYYRQNGEVTLSPTTCLLYTSGSRCLAANGSFRCLDFFPEFLLVAGQWHLRKS